ncbi:hypothetical protein BY458DRAFT_561288 [Sporodiniella umbellata]|nr:hypothetical protein BY458DRAFT_561288 [Sporodiniella umbellata]
MSLEGVLSGWFGNSSPGNINEKFIKDKLVKWEHFHTLKIGIVDEKINDYIQESNINGDYKHQILCWDDVKSILGSEILKEIGYE